MALNTTGADIFQSILGLDLDLDVTVFEFMS